MRVAENTIPIELLLKLLLTNGREFVLKILHFRLPKNAIELQMQNIKIINVRAFYSQDLGEDLSVTVF